jgi:hypothetical protein
LPVAPRTKLERVINLKTAKALEIVEGLGLMGPSQLRARANEMID